MRLQRIIDNVKHADCWDYYFPVHDYEPYGARFMSADRAVFEEELANIKHIEKTEVIPFTDLLVIDFSKKIPTRHVDEDGSVLMTPTAEGECEILDGGRKPPARKLSPAAADQSESFLDVRSSDIAGSGGKTTCGDNLVSGIAGETLTKSTMGDKFPGVDKRKGDNIQSAVELRSSDDAVSGDKTTDGDKLVSPKTGKSDQCRPTSGDVVDLSSPSVSAKDCSDCFEFTNDLDYQKYCSRRLRGILFIMALEGTKKYDISQAFFLKKYDRNKPTLYYKEDYTLLVEHLMIKAGLKPDRGEDLIQKCRFWDKDVCKTVVNNIKNLEEKIGCWDKMSNDDRSQLYSRHMGLIRGVNVTHEEEQLWLALYEHDEYQAHMYYDGWAPDLAWPNGYGRSTWADNLRENLSRSKRFWLYDTEEGRKWRKDEEKKKFGLQECTPPKIPPPWNPRSPGGREIKPWHPLQSPQPSVTRYSPKSCCSSATENFPGIYGKKTSPADESSDDDVYCYESGKDNSSMRDFIVNSDEDEEDYVDEGINLEGGSNASAVVNKKDVMSNKNRKRDIPAKVTKSTKTKKGKKRRNMNMEDEDVTIKEGAEVAAVGDESGEQDEDDEHVFHRKKDSYLASSRRLLFTDDSE